MNFAQPLVATTSELRRSSAPTQYPLEVETREFLRRSSTSGRIASGAEAEGAGRGRDDLGAAARSPLTASPCRLGRLAACAAIVLLALLFALPATAQTTTIWSATLTVDVRNVSVGGGTVTYKGCSSTGSIAADDCSVTLSDNEFTHGGTTYTVERLLWNNGGKILIEFTGISGSAAKTGLSAASLNAGSNVLPFASGAINDFDEWVEWTISDPGWTDGQQVSVSLTIPRATDPDPSNAAPTVTVTAASTTVAPGGTVALTATASDSDGFIVSYFGARGPLTARITVRPRGSSARPRERRRYGRRRSGPASINCA